MTISGSMTFPRELDIFSPFSPRVNPWTTTVLRRQITTIIINTIMMDILKMTYSLERVSQFDTKIKNLSWQITHENFSSKSNSKLLIHPDYYYFFYVWSYLLVTLRTSHFWLDSDLEVEALREDSLRLLAICSCRFSLASFILLAKSLAYFCSLFFIFLSTMFPQSIMPAFVLQNSWSHETLNLGCFSPRFLTVFV